MSIVAAVQGEATVAGRADRNSAGGLISDVAVYVGIDNVLSRRVELRERAAKLFPILRAVNLEERVANTVV